MERICFHGTEFCRFCSPHGNKKVIKRGLVNRALFASFALLASVVVVGSALRESTEPTTIRITTWNLEMANWGQI
jgi:hypothetical protein